MRNNIIIKTEVRSPFSPTLIIYYVTVEWLFEGEEIAVKELLLYPILSYAVLLFLCVILVLLFSFFTYKKGYFNERSKQAR